LKDFDVLSPPKRLAKIGGEKIDVSIIPARAALMFANFSQKYPTETFEKLKSGNSADLDPEMIKDILDVVEAVCKRSSKLITKDWLLDNVDFVVFMQFIDYVFAGLSGSDTGGTGGSGETGKN
jgi:hypothetical protein